jgi:iron complex outermembrane receptor protein
MKYITLFVFTFIIFANTWAQTSDITKDTIAIEEVIVTGTPTKVNRNNVPMSVSVVTREQLAQSGESAVLPVLNGLVPGLFVTERGVTGFGVSANAAGQITMRGIGGSPTRGVLMLIDGHPQFMGIFGHPLADSYVTSDIEKVEVIRGPASILYGSNAMGGAINLITRKQTEEGIHGNASLMYGSFNTQKYMAAVGYKKNRAHVFASFNRNQTDGHRANANFKINNGYIKAGYELNRNIRLNTDFSIALFKTTDPGPDTLGAKVGNSLDIMRGYWSLDLQNEFEKTSGALKLFYNFGEHNISDGFHSFDKNYGINIHESYKAFSGNSISIGADYVKYGGKAENKLAQNGEGEVYKDTLIYEAAVYGFVQQTLFEKLTLNAGLRLQNHEVYGTQWIPSGGFAFRITPSTTWKASIAKGFRSPSIQELYIWSHNSKLNPETVINYETSILQSLANHKLQIELTVFRITGDNLIITVPQKGLQNADEIDNKGVELLINVNPIKNLEISTTYSFIDMKAPVYATPKHHFNANVRYSLGKWSASANVRHVNTLDTDPTAKVNFENYTVCNAKLTFKAWKHLAIFMSADNLFNEKYETNRYYSMPGTTIFGGLNLNF